MSTPPRGSQILAWLALPAVLALCAWSVAADEQSRALAANTLLLSGTVAIASVLLGAPLAFLIARTDIRGRRLLGPIVLAMALLPLYLQTAAWQAGFGLQGRFTPVLGTPWLDGWRGAIAIHTLAAIPWVVAIIAIALRLVEPELEEAALLNATPLQVFTRVTLWRSLEAAGVAALWVGVTTASEITVTDVFLVRTFAEQLYTEFALGDSLDAPPWRLAPSIAATAATLVIGLALTSRLIPPQRVPTPRRALEFRLGSWRSWATLFTWSYVALLAALPAICLATKAGTVVTRDGNELVRQWSLAQFGSMTLGSPQRFAAEFAWSAAIGATAATAAVIIALALAWQACGGGWRALPAWLVIATGLALPGPLIGLGLVAIFNRPDWPWLLEIYDRSIVVVAIAQLLRVLPLCTLVLWYALRTIPSELLASATLEGATPRVRFFRIVLPQRWGAVAIVWLMALALAGGELSASILVLPPGVITLPIQIFNLIHYGVDDRVAGISLDLMLLFFVLSLLLAVVARRAAVRQ